MILLVLNAVVRVFLTNPVTKRCRRCQNSSAWIRLFFTCDPRNRKVFELQTVLQSMENLHVPSKRVAQVKNSSGPLAFSLCGPCKEHTEKEVSRKDNEGKGYRVRPLTPVMVLFNKSSFRILPVKQIW